MRERNLFINEFKNYLRTLDTSGFETQFIWGYASRLLTNSAYLDCRDEIMHILRAECDDEGEYVIYEWIINTCTDPMIIDIYDRCRKKTAFPWCKGDARGELWSNILEYGSDNDKDLLRLQLREYAYFIRDCRDRIIQMLDDSLMDNIPNDELATYKQDIEEMAIRLSKEIYSMAMYITHNLYEANSNKVYRGIFWIKDISNCEMICAKIACDIDGTILNQDDIPLNSRNGDNYNHERTWLSFDKRIVGNKAFNYYPRGRVEINNGIAKIFLNPHINKERIIESIKKKFNLVSERGITKVKVIPDYSEHYHCFLDEE